MEEKVSLEKVSLEEVKALLLIALKMSVLKERAARQAKEQTHASERSTDALEKS